MSVAKFIDFVQEEGSKRNPPLPYVGEVVGVNPLQVSFNGMEPLDEDQIFSISESYKEGQTVIIFPTSSSRYVVAGVVEP